MPQEFSPKDTVIHMLHLWWLIVICMVLGGLTGLVIHYFRPPIYQAKATLYTTIDFQKITDVKLTEYDEDMSINSVQSVMLSNNVIESVLIESAKSDFAIDYTTFMNHMNIYRKFSDFELLYRDSDPNKAQMVVNEWAKTGIQEYKRLRGEGNLPLYVDASIDSLAELPLTPVHQVRNSYVLAGSILGLVLGVILSSTQAPSTFWKKTRQQ